MQIRLFFLAASLDSQECKTMVAFWIQIQVQSKFVCNNTSVCLLPLNSNKGRIYNATRANSFLKNGRSLDLDPG